MNISFEDELFQKSNENTYIAFILKIPKFKEEMVWTPEMTIHYEIKKFNEESILKHIETFRREFCSHIWSSVYFLVNPWVLSWDINSKEGWVVDKVM